MTFVIGLTGGIGSGKSAVADAFAARGIEVADADAVVHALSRPGESGHRAIVETFGPRALQPDGALDRRWLREQAFADDAFRVRLEAALHPRVREALDEAIRRWRGPYGILMVPLLLERRGALRDRCDRVLVVDCDEDEQVRRVGRRSGLAPDEVRAIMAKQISRSDRLAQADDVIDNSGPPESLIPQVERLDRLYRAMADGKANA